MKVTTSYMVEVTYSSKFYPDYDDKIEKKIGPWAGCGMGLGATGGDRDLCWIFGTDKEKADKFLKRAKSKLRGMKLKVELVKYDSQPGLKS